MSHKQSITVTPEFHDAIEAYRQKQGINSWSSALIQLAKIALEWEGVATPQWGGDRKSEEWGRLVEFMDSKSPAELEAFFESIEG